MIDEFELYGTNWKGEGYYGCKTPLKEELIPQDIYSSPWDSWAIILAEAKLGQFEHVPMLLDLYNVKDPVLRCICFELFGDAAPSFAFQSLVEQIESNMNIDRILYSCEALAVRGRLADIPIMMEAYIKNYKYKDASTIPVQIRYVIGEITPTPIDTMSLDKYREEVNNRCQLLADRFGSEDVLLFRGELIGAIQLSNLILYELSQPQISFNFLYRRRFEAFTGINCSNFYSEDEVLQPLSAATIIESFLDSAEIDKFERGVRYFFGHQIPVK